jgi:HSP20 family protein
MAIKPEKSEDPQEKDANRRAGIIESAWEPVVQLRQEMDRLFDDFWPGWSMGSSGRRPGVATSPFRATMEPFADRPYGWGVELAAVDVLETDTALVIRAELPGVNENDIEVRLSPDTLTIKGEKTEQRSEGGAKGHFHLSERRYGAFRRSFRLPEAIDGDNVHATFKNGVLVVTLPKNPDVVDKSRKIDVKAEA